MKALIVTTWALAILATAFALGMFLGATELETDQGLVCGVILFVLLCVLLALTVDAERV